MDDYEIVFFNTPIYMYSVDDNEDYLPPLGQGYIVTQLIKNGIKAKIIDCVYERMGIDEVISIINNGTFPNVALNIFSVNFEIVKAIVEKTTRKINWYFGGKAIKHLWEQMLFWDWHENQVVYTIGECDSLFVDLLLKRCKEPPIYQKENQTAYYVNKDSIYFPRILDNYVLNRELFKGRASKTHYGKWEQSIIASRECIYNCAFCGGSRYANAGSTVRSRSSENIVREIQEIISIEPHVNSIRILDDLFLKNRRSTLQAIEIFNQFPTIHWRAMAHVTSFLNSQDLLEKLKECGCDELFIGIESGSVAIRKQIHKEGSIEDVVYVITGLLEVGIDVKGYFVCGFPGETKTQIAETVRLANRLKQIASSLPGNFRATAFQFRPYHGTEIFDQLQREGKTIGEYSVEKNTASKMQYSIVANNFSEVNDIFLKESINAIADGAIYEG